MKPKNIQELFELFEAEKSWDQIDIEILPNGEIRRVGDHSPTELKPGQKPLTFREYLGGEYGRSCSC
jgi:hypothetical protein